MDNASLELAGRYDLVATMPAGTSKEQLQLMLRNLLADRFGLKAHMETRNTKAYALGRDLSEWAEIAEGKESIFGRRTGGIWF